MITPVRMLFRGFIIAWMLSLLYQVGHAQPLKALEQPFTKYRVSTTQCTKLKHFTGSVIFVPDNAFALEGENRPDSVDLYYREMHSPLDMVIHDLSMVTQLMGRTFLLQSNGMFEIWAKHASDTIQIHENRSIEVRMAVKPTNLDPRMEGFRYDSESNTWASYANRLGHLKVNTNDEDLWGSSPVQNTFSTWGDEELLDDPVEREAFQALEIYDFGLYNYDRIIDGEEFVPVKAEFIAKNGSPVSSKIFVAYEELNSVIYFYPSQWENQFTLIKGRPYELFAISDQGNIFSLQQYPDLEAIAGKSHVFQLV
ncbi:MAG: hypothetical protein R3345_14390, partial [Fulvivirga sp.]|nr:hypothetical protein [Fulvivirga sp.]